MRDGAWFDAGEWTEVVVWLQGCTLSNNTASLRLQTTLPALDTRPPPTVYVDNGGDTLGGTVYTDDVSLSVCAYEGAEERTDAFELVCPEDANGYCYREQPCNETQPKLLTDSRGVDNLLMGDDSWFVGVKQVWTARIHGILFSMPNQTNSPTSKMPSCNDQSCC